MQEQVRRLGQSLEDRLKKTVQDSISAGSDGTGKGTDGKGRDGRGRGRDGKGRGRDGKGTDGKGRDGKGRGRDGKGKDVKGKGAKAGKTRDSEGSIKRSVEGAPKVGSMSWKVTVEDGWTRVGNERSRWFKDADCRELLVTMFGYTQQQAAKMCLPVGLDTFPGAAVCPCSHVRGHETHDSECHSFPSDYGNVARNMLRTS